MSKTHSGQMAAAGLSDSSQTSSTVLLTEALAAVQLQLLWLEGSRPHM